jgi:hypothetical protein
MRQSRHVSTATSVTEGGTSVISKTNCKSYNSVSGEEAMRARPPRPSTAVLAIQHLTGQHLLLKIPEDTPHGIEVTMATLAQAATAREIAA